jgi:hypothetical protein
MQRQKENKTGNNSSFKQQGKIVTVSRIFLRHVREIKDLAFENAIIFDKSGNFLFRMKGKRYSIEFDYYDRYRLQENIFMHNHPCGGGFSLSDIWSACALNMSGMIAVTQEYIYMFFPPYDRQVFEISEFRNIRHCYEIRKDLTPLSKRLKVNDEIWKNIATDLGYQYLKLKIKK